MNQADFQGNFPPGASVQTSCVTCWDSNIKRATVTPTTLSSSRGSSAMRFGSTAIRNRAAARRHCRHGELHLGFLLPCAARHRLRVSVRHAARDGITRSVMTTLAACGFAFAANNQK